MQPRTGCCVKGRACCSLPTQGASKGFSLPRPRLVPCRCSLLGMDRVRCSAVFSSSVAGKVENADVESVSVPVDYYTLLQVPHNAGKKTIKSAYEQLSAARMPAAFTSDTIFSRAVLLKSAAECLGDSGMRRSYDKKVSSGGHELLVSQTELPGALILLQETGNYNKVIKLAEGWMAIHYKSSPYAADVAACLALAFCDRAGSLLEHWMGKDTSHHLIPVCEDLERAGWLLRHFSMAPDLLEQIQDTLLDYAPLYTYELLALPLNSKNEDGRARGMSTLHSCIRAVGEEEAESMGHGQAVHEQRRSSLEELVAKCRLMMTADEQVSIDPAIRQYCPWILPGHSYCTALALISVALVKKLPRLVVKADRLFKELESSSSTSEGRAEGLMHLERAVCATLLGDQSLAFDLLGLPPVFGGPPSRHPQDPEIVKFVQEHSPSRSDLQPGLHHLVECWVQDAVLRHFREHHLPSPTSETVDSGSIASTLTAPTDINGASTVPAATNKVSAASSVIAVAVTAPSVSAAAVTAPTFVSVTSTAPCTTAVAVTAFAVINDTPPEPSSIAGAVHAPSGINTASAAHSVTSDALTAPAVYPAGTATVDGTATIFAPAAPTHSTGATAVFASAPTAAAADIAIPECSPTTSSVPSPAVAVAANATGGGTTSTNADSTAATSGTTFAPTSATSATSGTTFATTSATSPTTATAATVDSMVPSAPANTKIITSFSSTTSSSWPTACPSTTPFTAPLAASRSLCMVGSASPSRMLCVSSNTTIAAASSSSTPLTAPLPASRALCMTGSATASRMLSVSSNTTITAVGPSSTPLTAPLPASRALCMTGSATASRVLSISSPDVHPLLATGRSSSSGSSGCSTSDRNGSSSGSSSINTSNSGSSSNNNSICSVVFATADDGGGSNTAARSQRKPTVTPPRQLHAIADLTSHGLALGSSTGRPTAAPRRAKHLATPVRPATTTTARTSTATTACATAHTRLKEGTPQSLVGGQAGVLMEEAQPPLRGEGQPPLRGDAQPPRTYGGSAEPAAASLGLLTTETLSVAQWLMIKDVAQYTKVWKMTKGMPLALDLVHLLLRAMKFFKACMAKVLTSALSASKASRASAEILYENANQAARSAIWLTHDSTMEPRQQERSEHPPQGPPQVPTMVSRQQELWSELCEEERLIEEIESSQSPGPVAETDDLLIADVAFDAEAVAAVVRGAGVEEALEGLLYYGVSDMGGDVVMAAVEPSDSMGAPRHATPAQSTMEGRALPKDPSPPANLRAAPVATAPWAVASSVLQTGLRKEGLPPLVLPASTYELVTPSVAEDTQRVRLNRLRRNQLRRTNRSSLETVHVSLYEDEVQHDPEVARRLRLQLSALERGMWDSLPSSGGRDGDSGIADFGRTALGRCVIGAVALGACYVAAMMASTQASRPWALSLHQNQFPAMAVTEMVIRG